MLPGRVGSEGRCEAVWLRSQTSPYSNSGDRFASTVANLRPEGGPMNTQVYKALAVIAFLALLSVPVTQAQSDTLVANIPFDFHVGKASLPSGVSNIKPVAQQALMIQSKDGQGVVATTIAVDSPKSLNTGKLVFNRYGDQYFLSKVLPPGASTGRELPKSRNEIEVAKNL